MTNEQTLMELARTSDRLGDLADQYFDADERHSGSVSSLLKKAELSVEEAREALRMKTRQAVAEVVNIAAKQRCPDLTGPVESHILREKAA
jgi:hypothetical protein